MSTVRYDVVDGLARIVLARPQAGNALDGPTVAAFGRAVDRAEDAGVRAVLLLGSGPRFCTGGDVRAFKEADDPAGYLHRLAVETEAHLRRLTNLPAPVVAGVHGAVAGAGLAFVLNADLVVAGRSTQFLAAYANLGLTPDCGVSWMLPRVVGTQRALDFTLGGRLLDAETALAWGLITEVVDDVDVPEHAEALSRRLAALPTWALGQTKRLVRSAWTSPREANALDEADTIAAAVVTSAARQRIEKFLA
jgi:2-(1,2-epoxy-1,2-dihydrophenyl)acetyl-CoA isomerase